jgi:hypothetical protein
MNTDSDGGLDFDELLERELRRRVGGLLGPSPGVGQAAYRAVTATGGKRMPLLSSLAAAASSRAAIGLATAALVIGGGTATVAFASDSPNPTTWGKTVTDAITTCTGQLKDGQHGIGQCVSAIAKRKGVEERASHAASAARENQPSSIPSGHPTGKPTGLPTGPPTSPPGGKPSGVPAGPPASLPPATDGSHPTGPPVVPPTPHQ